MSVERQRLVMVCCSDIAGMVRGKGFPLAELEGRWRFGVGWTPTNTMINCFGRIPATPFGPRGDLFLVPKPEGEVVLDFADGTPVKHFILGEITNLDGSAWDCCLRSLLRRSLARLEAEAGLKLYGAFEHEFHYSGTPGRQVGGYALEALGGTEPFVEEFLGALQANGLEPETLLPEYGPGQLEVTVKPAFALEAADRAVKLREICRSVARRHGARVSFAPVVTYGVVGNGVHIHFSLTDAAGRPVTYDPAAPHGLGAKAGSFVAGILRHARALAAVTAPSVASYERLKPNSWSAFYGNLGYRDREALVRICPLPEVAEVDPAPRYNLEFRAADATGSPYLQLALLVLAGLRGLRENLPTPSITEDDPAKLMAEQRAALGIVELPHSLEEALQALETDSLALEWLGPTLAKAYLLHKRGELGMTEGRGGEALCRLYAEVY